MADEVYRVELTRRAQRDLRPLRSVLTEATEALLRLETDPEAGEPLTGSLQGVRSLHWRVRRVEYRAAYLVLPLERVCLVFQIGTRENFYREAERRHRALVRTGVEGEPSTDGEEAPGDGGAEA